MFQLLLAILALGILIIVHEWGHFVVARLSGMRVDRFAIGFGPAILRRKRGETAYQIGAIPLGGYVQIAGMNPEDDAINPQDPRAYPNRPAWQRFFTIAAGPLVNYLFAMLLLFGLYLALGIQSGQRITLAANVLPDRPAAKGGMLAEDRILTVNGEKITGPSQVAPLVAKAEGKPLPVEIERKGQRMTLSLVPVKDGEVWRIGVELDSIDQRRRAGLGEALRHAVTQPAVITWNNLIGFGRIFSGRQKVGIDDFQSPVGITKMIKRSFERSAADGLEFVAMISALLGFFNLLPLPALDGGRLMFLGWELVTRRPVNQRVEQIVHFVGMVLLLGLLLLLMAKDLRNWIFPR
ncbi:MAG: M50 family metallopeptidase [Polyangia bacterium]